MTIIIDGMGGDNAPLEILKGCAMAVEEYGIDIIVTGPSELLKKTAEENNISMNRITIEEATEIITMEDAPESVLRGKPNSSMAVAMKLLRDGKGDALVSAGNSGAVLMGATLIVKRIKGISRAAFAPVIPSQSGHVMLVDSGANTTCTPQFLEQFAVMGYAYMKHMGFSENPRVGLVNNGTEETKGTELYQETHQLLKKNPHINFIGNVEGRNVMGGGCEVAVCDGFSGNLLLKGCEGTATFFFDELKRIFTTNFLTKIAYLILKKHLKALKKKADYNEVGGAVVLGVSKPVIKAHGSSKAKSFKNAIGQAITLQQSGTIQEIEENTAKISIDN